MSTVPENTVSAPHEDGAGRLVEHCSPEDVSQAQAKSHDHPIASTRQHKANADTNETTPQKHKTTTQNHHHNNNNTTDVCCDIELRILTGGKKEEMVHGAPCSPARSPNRHIRRILSPSSAHTAAVLEALHPPTSFVPIKFHQNVRWSKTMWLPRGRFVGEHVRQASTGGGLVADSNDVERLAVQAGLDGNLVPGDVNQSINLINLINLVDRACDRACDRVANSVPVPGRRFLIPRCQTVAASLASSAMRVPRVGLSAGSGRWGEGRCDSCPPPHPP